ncbi:S41 family peptidase [Cochleicola gelatinilyticus]|uniref:Tail specific protease domain-containing protein n=1 Tax=Cochleicola gelatinilyticus TaxID=1763537 RepID=A0A167IPV0_9FLAO|nr:S41 family peptidase [Cochleicola gelatinilyticus]OAB79893.1 hypothetical protein ULVI_03900 [Cochleicola gelatinilyticus]
MLENDFKYITLFIENNYPGFQIAIREKGMPAYNALKSEVEIWISQNPDATSTQFLKAIKPYLSFFKDKHLRAYDPETIDEKGYFENIKEEKKPKINLIKGYKKGVCCLTIPSFNLRLWKELDAVYTILPKVAKNKDLIIDLRNNSGGGERMYKELLHILKKRNADQTVLLINRNCASATEAFIFKASKFKKVLSMGENTNGQFAYGEIKRNVTPHLGIVILIPTKVYKQWLPYEYIGLAPDKHVDTKTSMSYALEYLEALYN